MGSVVYILHSSEMEELKKKNYETIEIEEPINLDERSPQFVEVRVELSMICLKM